MDEIPLPDNLPELNTKKKIKKNKKNNSEELEQFQFISFLKTNYPDILFRVAVDGVRLSIGTAVKLKKNGVLQKSLPDIEIFYPTKDYHGLFIEMKITGRKLFKKDNSYIDEHTLEQAQILTKFNQIGYYASFGLGYEHAKNILISYINNDYNELLKLKTI
jgi:hypothetical protein